MPTKPSGKEECRNSDNGRCLLINAATYGLFSKAIDHTLMRGKELTHTPPAEGVHDCFKKQKTAFTGSVEWQAVRVKNDLEAGGVLETFTAKGKKWKRLAAAQPETTRAPF